MTPDSNRVISRYLGDHAGQALDLVVDGQIHLAKALFAMIVAYWQQLRSLIVLTSLSGMGAS